MAPSVPTRTKTIIILVFVKLLDLLNSLLIFIAEKYQNNPKSHKSCVKVSKILWCTRVAPFYLECNFGRDDFVSMFEKFAAPEIILNESITLYALREQEALFVDTGSMTLMEAQPGWLYLFQWEAAKKLISMPLDVFTEMSDNIDFPRCSIIHIANHTRCGGTLMSRVFQSIPGALVITEPLALSCVAFFSAHHTFSADKIHHLYVSTLKCLFKHASLKNLDIVCLKSWLSEMFILELMFEATPFIKHIYLYRNPLMFVKSWEKLHAVNQFPMMPVGVVKARCYLYPVLSKSPKFTDENIRRMSWYEIWALHWIRSYAGFMYVYRQNYPISTIKFEDFISDPDQVMLKIFKYAEISESHLPDAKAVLETDSQKGTIYTSRGSENLRMDLFTPITRSLKKKVDDLCNLFDAPSFWSGEIELPNKLQL